MQHESAVKNAEPKASHGNLKPARGTTEIGQPRLLAASDSHSILQRAQEDPLSLTNADLQRLQATAGPEAVQRLLARDDVRQARRIDVPVPEFHPMPQLQAKLTVGPAGDRYEQEADRVAHQVVNMPMPAPTQGIAASSAVQREEADEEELQMNPLVQREEADEEELQMKPLVQREEADEDELQMKSLVQRTAWGGFDAGKEFESQVKSSKGAGRSLDAHIRREFEPKFGADFSKVRVHTGRRSEDLNRQVQAKAFTHGSDIHFNAGQYNPGSSAGKRLLAHELTHTIQQGTSTPVAESSTLASGAVAQRGGEIQLQEKKGDSYPSKEVTSAPAMTIQRRLNWTPAMLGDNVSTKAKFNKLIGDESTFSMLRKRLGLYQETNGLAEELHLLEGMRDLAGLWLVNDRKDNTKKSIVEFLLEDIKVEISKVQQQISDDAKEQDEYLRKIESKELTYITKSGSDVAGKMKNWHAGQQNDQDDDRAPTINKLTKTYGLTLSEATAIAIYTASDYRYMNPATAKDEGWMRSQLEKPTYANANLKNELAQGITDKHVQVANTEGNLHSKIALAGLRKLPDWKGVVYRGMGLTEEDFQSKYGAGKSTVFPAFSSSSLEKHTAESFIISEATKPKNPVLLQLHLTKGKDIQALSNAEGEKEILMMPGATFKTKKITKTKFMGSRDMYVVDLVQVK